MIFVAGKRWPVRVWMGVGISALLFFPLSLGLFMDTADHLTEMVPGPLFGFNTAAIRRSSVFLVHDIMGTVAIADHGETHRPYQVSVLSWLAGGSVRTVGDMLRLLDIPLTDRQAAAVLPCKRLVDIPSSESIVVRADPWQSGLASWYGPGFDGRTAASGETYDMDDITAAHRTLPLGSIVRVVHRASGRSLVLRINDRGPYVAGRILDLSRGAKDALDVGDLSAVYLERIDPVALNVPCV